MPHSLPQDALGLDISLSDEDEDEPDDAAGMASPLSGRGSSIGGDVEPWGAEDVSPRRQHRAKGGRLGTAGTRRPRTGRSRAGTARSRHRPVSRWGGVGEDVPPSPVVVPTTQPVPLVAQFEEKFEKRLAVLDVLERSRAEEAALEEELRTAEDKEQRESIRVRWCRACRAAVSEAVWKARRQPTATRHGTTHLLTCPCATL